MLINPSLISGPAIEEAIDHQPLTVSPDTLLVDVIALMSQTQGQQCELPRIDAVLDEIVSSGARASGVLIVQGTELLGIFTERDIVQLIAWGVDFASVKIADVMVHPVITLPKADFKDVFAALFLFRRHRIRHLVLVDDQGCVAGVVTPESIRQVLRPANLLKLRRVADVMSDQVVHAPLTTSVIGIARLIAEHRVSCVVITDKSAQTDMMPVGIVTERDLVQFQALGLDLAHTQAQTVMSTPLFLLSPEDSLWMAHQEMQRRHVQRLVVSWNWGDRLGIVTQTSLLRVFDPVEMYGVIETLQQTVYQLETEKSGLASGLKPST